MVRAPERLREPRVERFLDEMVIEREPGADGPDQAGRALDLAETAQHRNPGLLMCVRDDERVELEAAARRQLEEVPMGLLEIGESGFDQVNDGRRNRHFSDAARRPPSAPGLLPEQLALLHVAQDLEGEQGIAVGLAGHEGRELVHPRSRGERIRDDELNGVPVERRERDAGHVLQTLELTVP